MGKKVSKAGKNSYNEQTYARNKKRKLERHLKKYPTDECAKKCFETGLKIGFPLKRKTPKTPTWSHTDKHHAQVWASLGHNGNKYLDFLKKLKRGVTKTTPALTKEPNVQLVD